MTGLIAGLGDRTTTRSTRIAKRGLRIGRWAAIIAVVGLSACSGSDDGDGSSGSKSSASAASTTTRDLPEPSAELTLKPDFTKVYSAGPDITLDASISRQVTRVVNAYIQTGILDPLLTGATGDDFETLFGLGVLGHVQPDQPDRAALTEEGTPRATGRVRSRRGAFDLTGLADRDGVVTMVTGRILIHLDVPTDGGVLKIDRAGDLVFEPTNEGEWLISGYAVATTRDDGGSDRTTTTTARAGATTEASS
jgi:hypothetical protein